MNIKKLLERAEDVFFEALLNGYVDSEKKNCITKEEDGYKIIVYQKDDFEVVDRYCSPLHSKKSAGTTTILFRMEPIWWMGYCGIYEKEIIPFLKEALREAYINKEFFGGRGPKFFERDQIVYRNNLARNSFILFSGREEVYKKNGKTFGYHRFHGMSLLE